MGRRLGQHFLYDGSILERIATSACPQPVDLCIEIGPGPGGLSAALLNHCQRLVAVELDPELARTLRARFATQTGFELVEGDVLDVDLAQWGRATVCGNLPYYITSPIIERVLGLGALLERAVFLVQKEVADRLTAGPGSRDYGYLSVAVQARARVERVFIVKPGAFHPPPKVDSAVVRLTPVDAPPVEDMKGFLSLVSACFQAKRKTLRNNLAARYGAERARQAPYGDKRAEQLSMAELVEVFRSL